MALYGYQSPSITSYLRENSKVQVVEHHIEHQQQVCQLLKDNLTLAQNRMKQQADQHHSERSFDGRWMISIKCHKWGHFCCSMKGSVIPPFSERQPFDPLCMFIRYKATKISFQTFVYYLSLPIKLMMIR